MLDEYLRGGVVLRSQGTMFHLEFLGSRGILQREAILVELENRFNRVILWANDSLIGGGCDSHGDDGALETPTLVPLHVRWKKNSGKGYFYLIPDLRAALCEEVFAWEEGNWKLFFSLGNLRYAESFNIELEESNEMYKQLGASVEVSSEPDNAEWVIVIAESKLSEVAEYLASIAIKCNWGVLLHRFFGICTYFFLVLGLGALMRGLVSIIRD